MAVSKFSLVLFVVATFALFHVQSFSFEGEDVLQSRANLIIGTPSPTDQLLYRTNATKNAIGGITQTQDVVYRGFAVNITHIMAIENGFSQNATARLVGGGLGATNATIRLTSAPSRGYNYTISVWGR